MEEKEKWYRFNALNRAYCTLLDNYLQEGENPLDTLFNALYEVLTDDELKEAEQMHGRVREMVSKAMVSSMDYAKRLQS